MRRTIALHPFIVVLLTCLTFVQFQVAAEEQPVPPNDLTAVLYGTAQQAITWTPPSGSATWQLMRNYSYYGPVLIYEGPAENGQFYDYQYTNYGETIEYFLVAYDGLGNAYSSNTATVTNLVPVPPSDLAATPVSGGNRLTWTTYTDCAGFRLYRGVPGASDLVQEGAGAAGARTVLDTSIPAGINFGDMISYYVDLVDSNGATYTSYPIQAEYVFAPTLNAYFDSEYGRIVATIDVPMPSNSAMDIEVSFDGGTTFSSLGYSYGNDPFYFWYNWSGEGLLFRTRVLYSDICGPAYPLNFTYNPPNAPSLIVETYGVQPYGFSVYWNNFTGAADYVVERSIDGGPFEPWTVLNASPWPVFSDYPWDLNTPLLYLCPPVYRVKSRNPAGESEYASVAFSSGSLTLSDSEVVLAQGAQHQFSISGTDPFFRALSGNSIEWYGGGFISNTGMFTASVGGTYTVTVKAHGLMATATLTVLDEAAPVLASFEPVNGSLTDNRRPTITGSLTDASGVNWSTLMVALDGASIPVTFSGSSFTYTPNYDLSFGQHTVDVYVTDIHGNPAEWSWTFLIGVGLHVEIVGNSGMLPVTFSAVAIHDGVDVTAQTQFAWFATAGQAQGGTYVLPSGTPAGQHTIQVYGIYGSLGYLSAEGLADVGQTGVGGSVLSWAGQNPGGDVGGPKDDTWSITSQYGEQNTLEITFGEEGVIDCNVYHNSIAESGLPVRLAPISDGIKIPVQPPNTDTNGGTKCTLLPMCYDVEQTAVLLAGKTAKVFKVIARKPTVRVINEYGWFIGYAAGEATNDFQVIDINGQVMTGWLAHFLTGDEFNDYYYATFTSSTNDPEHKLKLLGNPLMWGEATISITFSREDNDLSFREGDMRVEMRITD